jgi:hypothetical protein
VRKSICVSSVRIILLIALVSCFDCWSSGGQVLSVHNASPVVLEINGLGGEDLPPSEDVLAATTCLTVGQSGTAPRYLNYLETWDFRDSRLLQREPLVEDGLPTASCAAGDVRYSGDGKLLVARTASGDLVRVFSAETLKLLRTIQIPLRLHEFRVGNSIISVDWQAEVTGFEISPLRHLLALRMYRGDRDKRPGAFIDPPQYLGGIVRVYDLDSGTRINEWEIPTGYAKGGSGLAWRQDGKVLAAAASDRMRCESGGGAVYTFDLSTSKLITRIRVPNLVGDIAFGTSDTLYVANGSCAGYFGNKKPRLPIFNAVTGKKLGEIEFVDSGIRYYLAVSANRQALLGYVGREEMRWEFEDTLEEIDHRFAVWDLATRREVYVSANLDGLIGFVPELSASGRWALLQPTNKHGQVWLFPLPTFLDSSANPLTLPTIANARMASLFQPKETTASP